MNLVEGLFTKLSTKLRRITPVNENILLLNVSFNYCRYLCVRFALFATCRNTCVYTCT